jgi:hypothetical protein
MKNHRGRAVTRADVSRREKTSIEAVKVLPLGGASATETKTNQNYSFNNKILEVVLLGQPRQTTRKLCVSTISQTINFFVLSFLVQIVLGLQIVVLLNRSCRIG